MTLGSLFEESVAARHGSRVHYLSYTRPSPTWLVDWQRHLHFMRVVSSTLPKKHKLTYITHACHKGFSTHLGAIRSFLFKRAVLVSHKACKLIKMKTKHWLRSLILLTRLQSIAQFQNSVLKLFLIDLFCQKCIWDKRNKLFLPSL